MSIYILRIRRFCYGTQSCCKGKLLCIRHRCGMYLYILHAAKQENNLAFSLPPTNRHISVISRICACQMC